MGMSTPRWQHTRVPGRTAPHMLCARTEASEDTAGSFRVLSPGIIEDAFSLQRDVLVPSLLQVNGAARSFATCNTAAPCSCLYLPSLARAPGTSTCSSPGLFCSRFCFGRACILFSSCSDERGRWSWGRRRALEDNSNWGTSHPPSSPKGAGPGCSLATSPWVTDAVHKP